MCLQPNKHINKKFIKYAYSLTHHPLKVHFKFSTTFFIFFCVCKLHNKILFTTKFEIMYAHVYLYGFFRT